MNHNQTGQNGPIIKSGEPADIVPESVPLDPSEFKGLGNAGLRNLEVTEESLMPDSKERKFEAVLAAELKVGYGALGRETTELEVKQTLEQILTPDAESQTGYKYLGIPSPDQPATCGDGRKSRGLLTKAVSPIRFKMFGGDLQSNWEADELIRSIEPVSKDGPVQRARNFMTTKMLPKNRKPGAHTSTDHAHGSSCACGAIDKHTESMETIVKELEGRVSPSERDELVILTSAAMTDEFDDALHNETTVPNAKRLAQEERSSGYTGKEFLDIIATAPAEELDGAQCIEDLEGNHDEWLFVVCQIEGVTLDRDKFVAETGKQVFWIDEPAIKTEANRYATNALDAKRRYQAMMTAQVAKGKTLARGGLKIAVLKEAA